MITLARILAPAAFAALAAGMLLGARDANAKAFDFEWDAPAECPRERFVEGEVERVGDDRNPSWATTVTQIPK